MASHNSSRFVPIFVLLAAFSFVLTGLVPTDPLGRRNLDRGTGGRSRRAKQPIGEKRCTGGCEIRRPCRRNANSPPSHPGRQCAGSTHAAGRESQFPGGHVWKFPRDRSFSSDSVTTDCACTMGNIRDGRSEPAFEPALSCKSGHSGTTTRSGRSRGKATRAKTSDCRRGEACLLRTA